MARFTVLYTPDRWPMSPWISRYEADAVPSSPGEGRGLGVSLHVALAMDQAPTCLKPNSSFLSPLTSLPVDRAFQLASTGHIRAGEGLIGAGDKPWAWRAMLEASQSCKLVHGLLLCFMCCPGSLLLWLCVFHPISSFSFVLKQRTQEGGSWPELHAGSFGHSSAPEAPCKSGKAM